MQLELIAESLSTNGNVRESNSYLILFCFLYSSYLRTREIAWIFYIRGLRGIRINISVHTYFFVGKGSTSASFQQSMG